MKPIFKLVIPLFISFFGFSLNAQVTITGELKQYHKTTLTFDGPSASESPDTFLNFRMNVTFTAPSGKTYVVPGYFAADGDAANTSATSGNKWRVHLNSDESGTWNYVVSFRTGTDIAVSSDPGAGNAGTFDGQSGSFSIADTDKTGDDFRAKGKLQYVNKPYAQFANGDHFYEVGADSPETFLEYGDFDATVGRHDFTEVAAYQEGDDPTWAGGKGAGIMGAVNYLASQGMNVQYFLVMNITGDGKEAFPFPNKTDYTTYDVSKLAQWQIVFDHMYDKGLIMEFVLTEDENTNWFETQESVGQHDFATSRKLYYRELVARFGYLNLVYNIGEEANWEHSGAGSDFYTAAQIEEAAAYIQALTPYSDLISVHNGPHSDFSVFDDVANLPGTSSLTCISLQGSYDKPAGHNQVKNIEALAQDDGTEWVLRYTEPYDNRAMDLDTWTNNSLWASLTAGAAGIQYYSNNGDITEDNYTLWSGFFTRMRYAKDFLMDNNIPFWNMYNDDGAVSNGKMLSDGSDNFVIFLENGGSTDINLPGTKDFTVKWFDPRNGGALQDGSVTSLSSGSGQSIGDPPNNTGSSWVVYVKSNQTLSARWDKEMHLDFKVYPNPISSGFVDISGLDDDVYKVFIYDIGGRLLNKTSKVLSKNNHRIKLNPLKPGMYILTMENPSRQLYTTKFIVK